MSAAKSSKTAKSAGTKKTAPRAPPTHPPWIDMIKVNFLSTFWLLYIVFPKFESVLYNVAQPVCSGGQKG